VDLFLSSSVERGALPVVVEAMGVSSEMLCLVCPGTEVLLVVRFPYPG
jgi:hypothetical protein